ncbi:MAG TPA: ABC transporter permease [Solirubrobacteraceae bacterium]|nr:ABC transporter permease [Solirubrobacteraceae bacterium]
MTSTQLDDPATGTDRAAPRQGIRDRIGDGAEAFALLGLAVVVAIFFSVLPRTSDVFPSVANFQALSGSQAVLAVAALAVLVPLICDEFDLSVGANLGLAGILSASAMSSGAPLIVGVLIAIGSGMAVGAVNGLLVTRAHVNAVVVTLGVATIIHGVVQAKTHGKSITEGIPLSLTDIGGGTWLGVPRILVVALLAAGVLYYVLAHTPYGRQLYMLGANRDAARLVGLRTDRLLFSTFVIAGALAGLAGILQVGRAGSAVPSTGDTFTLPAFAAAFLSAAAIRPGRFNVWGAIVALAFLAVINGGLNLAGAENYIQDFVNGTALIIGVGLAVWLRRTRRVVARAAPRDEPAAQPASP